MAGGHTSEATKRVPSWLHLTPRQFCELRTGHGPGVQSRAGAALCLHPQVHPAARAQGIEAGERPETDPRQRRTPVPRIRVTRVTGQGRAGTLHTDVYLPLSLTPPFTQQNSGQGGRMAHLLSHTRGAPHVPSSAQGLLHFLLPANQAPVCSNPGTELGYILFCGLTVSLLKPGCVGQGSRLHFF